MASVWSYNIIRRIVVSLRCSYWNTVLRKRDNGQYNHEDGSLRLYKYIQGWLREILLCIPLSEVSVWFMHVPVIGRVSHVMRKENYTCHKLLLLMIYIIWHLRKTVPVLMFCAHYTIITPELKIKRISYRCEDIISCFVGSEVKK